MKILDTLINLKLVYKFTGLFLIMALLVAATGSFGIWNIKLVGGKVREMMRVRSAQEKMAVLMKVTVQECRVHLLEAVMVRKRTIDFELHKGDYEDKKDRFRKYCDILLLGNPKLGLAAATPGSGLEQRVSVVRKNWAGFEAFAESLLSRKKSQLSLNKPDDSAISAPADPKLSALTEHEMYVVVDKVNVAIDDLIVIVVSQMNDTASEAAAIQRKAELTLVLVILSAILLAILLGMLSTRRIIITPIMKIKEAAEKVASGDFPYSPLLIRKDELPGPSSEAMKASNDEIAILARSFDIMTENLRKTTVSRDLLINEIEERKQAEQQIIMQRVELEERNSELSTLFKISTAINRTMDLNELASGILNTITELEILRVERKGGIFILDGEKMTLVSHLGHPDSFLDAHKDMKIGTCLCGRAAISGEIIISQSSHDDSSHSIQYPEMQPHGHIILPLKAMDKIVGVLYLYLPVDFAFDENIMQALVTAGNQIGIAINNCLLYEQTRMLSLHDPLTKLANRNLMNIELDRNFEKSRRTDTPFSVILLDLDHFKLYNDTHGHDGGDKLLVEFADILLHEVRKIDLVARFGGEEFLIILPDTGGTRAYEVAERIRKTVERKTDVTVSSGVSSFDRTMKEKEDLIKIADAALYQAKYKGRNRVEVSL